MKKIFWCIPVLLSSHIYPWSVSPATQSVVVAEPQAFFTVVGDDRESLLPVEVFAANRVMDKEGNDTWERNDADFIIYPKQLLLKKGQQQLVRVIWKGKEKIGVEKAYRIIFQEQPTRVPETVEDLKGTEGAKFSIGINAQYVCSFYVAKNSKVKPRVVVKDYTLETAEEKPILTCELSNQGEKHRILKKQNMELVVKYKDSANKLQTLVISGEKLGEGVNAITNLLAGHSRVFQIPWEEGYPRQIESVELHD